ncbi:hypothetical protein IJ579_03655 [bacterium]|nr:hypothetical protein [bacterium]
MKHLNKITVSIIIFIAFVILACYGTFLFVIPKILNSSVAQKRYKSFALQKLQLHTSFDNLKFETYPNLFFVMSFDKAEIVSGGNVLFKIENLKYESNVFNIKNGFLNVENIFADADAIKKYSVSKKNKKKNNLSLKFYPVINIKKILVTINKNFYIEAENINSKKFKHDIETTLTAKIFTPYTKIPIEVGEYGKIVYNKYFKANNFSIKLSDSLIFIDGDKNNLYLSAKDLPVSDLEKNFLFFYKLKHPNKKNFIENFDKFQGTLDVDLQYNKDGFSGNCLANNLSALFWTRKIPVNLPKTLFSFSGHSVSAYTQGWFGPEPVKTDVQIGGLATPNLYVEGNVYSTLTNKIVKKYLPEVSIQGRTPAKVKYTVNKNKVDVFYTLDINKNNNIHSDYGSLDNINTNRQLFAHTVKTGENIHLETFNYNIDVKNILKGNGDFVRENGHYQPQSAAIKTNGKIPTAIIKSFLKNYISDGALDADIKYEFKNKIITGNVNFYDIRHSDFLFLENTKINVKDNLLTMSTNGLFFNSPITALLTADNNLSSGIVINSIDIHLKKFILQKGYEISNIKNDKKNVYKNTFPIEVKQGRLVVDEIYHRKFDIKDVEVAGNLKNNIVNFVMPKASYAGGLLSATGKYDVKLHDSDIYTFASDIDSNYVATNFFKLSNQIQGIAFATAHFITKNKLNDIKADATFAIDDGFLPKLGSTEFIINKSKGKNSDKKKKFKIVLSKISNIDFSKPNVFYSNLYGTFTLDNELVKNVKIFSKSDYLSMFIEGNYDIDTECGNLYIWGRHNKTEAKKIRILKIPINWIYKVVFRPEHSAAAYANKIRQIPEIKARKTDDVSTFRVYVSGELNSDNKLKVELKDLR